VDVFFSSEEYGDELARRMGIRHVMVDQSRSTVPISATKVRQNPYAQWAFVPEVVRPYYIKRIVLTGPESTGKSVLAQKLAEHYQTNWVEEYGRTYCERFGTDLDDLDFAHIAGGQLLLEDKAARQANRILFCDTDLIVTQIWGDIYLQHCPQWILEMNHVRRYDLFLLLGTDIPWVDDGTRGYAEVRQWQWQRLKEELESRNLPYVMINGNFAERFDRAVAAVDKLLSLAP
jgi:NadR type nicotinamide-nucleotide adenylyltransferase